MPQDSPPTSTQLRIEIYSWWRSGTGAGRAAQLDALCVRDSDGLPYLPGRHIKGLFRDAVRRLGEWDPQFRGADVALFGEWGFVNAREKDANRDGDPVPYRGARRGALAFSDARMMYSERLAFAEDAAEAVEMGRTPLRDRLFHTLRSTAMDKGVAATHSLRAEEVAVPVRLNGSIDFLGFAERATAPSDENPRPSWLGVLQAAAPLIRAVGGKRARGLGRAAMFVEDVET